MHPGRHHRHLPRLHPHQRHLRRHGGRHQRLPRPLHQRGHPHHRHLCRQTEQQRRNPRFWKTTRAARSFPSPTATADPGPGRADGDGSSLEVVDAAGDFADPGNWRSSSEYGGTPGSAGAGPDNRIVINEVLTHTDPPLCDNIELFNTTESAIDIGGWTLSDADIQLREICHLQRHNPVRRRLPRLQRNQSFQHLRSESTPTTSPSAAPTATMSS